MNVMHLFHLPFITGSLLTDSFLFPSFMPFYISQFIANPRKAHSSCGFSQRPSISSCIFSHMFSHSLCYLHCYFFYHNLIY